MLTSLPTSITLHDVDTTSVSSELSTVSSAMMSSSQFAQSMPTPPTQFSEDSEPDENYVHGIEGDFVTRTQFWLNASPGCMAYNIQLAAVFEAGACINMNKLEKEPAKFKEMAIKYKESVEALRSASVITPKEFQVMQSLMHQKKKNKQITVEVKGWPAGKVLRDQKKSDSQSNQSPSSEDDSRHSKWYRNP